MAKTDLTAQRLRELLNYNPDTGIFTRRIRRSGPNGGIGETAGSKKTLGYIYIFIDNHPYLAHRLAWFYTFNTWPSGVIDHINGIRSDNRIANLRDVTISENAQNMRKGRSGSKVGYLGVSTKRNKWRASIYANGKTITLGVFDTPELARDAYVLAKRSLHSACTI